MKFLLGLLYLVAFGGAVSVRKKRDIANFSAMIYCTTGRSPLDYCGYGNWCGRGGSGYPVDGTDRCCKAHDDCWDYLYNSGTCTRFFSLVLREYFSAIGNCGRSDVRINCYNRPYNSCEKQLCECDKRAALCFRSSTYNPRNKNHNNCWY